MVRRVQPEQASVWLALEKPAKVELVVYDDGVEVLRGMAQTDAIGKGLHLALVTALPLASKDALQWGTMYTYALCIDGEPLEVADLLYEGGPGRLSFVLMGGSLSGTELVHGSCRHPTKPGFDALSILDDLLQASLTGDRARPQSFVCSGDMIYADSPSESLLALVGSLGETLLGYREELPGLPYSAVEIPLAERREMSDVHAKIYDPPARQLFGLGEYLAMHLLVLSPSLWPAEIPEDLQPFHASLGKVRRALANTSFYAIFDDHEVTDDWNLTRAWTERVLAAPLGRRMVCNGLAAFALVHSWGNQPERFASGAPGRALLQALHLGRAEDTQLSSLLGIPEEVGKVLVPPPGALRWHFRLKTPALDLRGLDTRTMREFPSEDVHGIPNHLSELALEEQLSNPEGFLVMVVPAPMAPPPFSRTSRFFRRLKNRWSSSQMELVDVYFPDRGDEWVPRSDFFKKVVEFLPPSWVCLGGDTHIGYAASLQTQRGKSAVFVSSGMQRQSTERNWRQHLGYRYPWPSFGSQPSLTTNAFAMHYLPSLKNKKGKRYEYFAQNNIGVLNFAMRKAGLRATHTLWWRPSEAEIESVSYQTHL